MLTVIVFLSGAVLMSLEMVGSRILAPTFGSSIYIWGALIMVVMAALTFGYYFGGRIADRLPNLLILGLILAAAGTFIGFLPFWTHPVNYTCAQLEPRVGSLLAALAFFFFPGILLAAVSPYGIKLAGHSLTNIGNTAGRLSAISSTGSIIGTLVTSFFLIPLMGVRNILHSLGLILLLLALAVFLQKSTRNNLSNQQLIIWLKRVGIMLILLIILILGVIWKAIPTGWGLFENDILYERDSLYHHIAVAQSGSLRYLRFDNSNQSAIDLDNPLQMVFQYTSYLHLGVVARPQPTKVLFIGLGGGSAPKKFLHDYPSLTLVDAVEIDPEVVKVARDYFQLPDDPRLRVITQDGRLFVEQTARQITDGRTTPYDLVIIDAYSSSTIPYHLTTYEFLQAIRKTLTPDGVVVSNIIGALNGSHSLLFRSMTRTFATVFPQIYIFPVGGSSGGIDTFERNIILIASLNPERWDKSVWQKHATDAYQRQLITEDVPYFAQTLIEEPFLKTEAWLADVPVLTDDYAPVDTLQHPLL